MWQNGIPGSAHVEGTARVGGIPPYYAGGGGTAEIVNQNPAVKRAVIFWTAAVVVLFVFHVGGAHLG